ncbi:hypothetical protein A2U01_0004833, partial [Trifolium medium]|nr:hypothetical protein [Trifolium medium]
NNLDDIEECKVTMNLKSDMTDLSMLRDNTASEVLVDMQGLDSARAGCFGLHQSVLQFGGRSSFADYGAKLCICLVVF